MEISSDPTTPTAVRALILEQHKGLRLRFGALDALALRVLAGEPGLAMELRRQIVELEGSFEDHLRTEERLLLPLLVRIDAWGPVRVAEIEEEHARQRQVLSRAGDRATNAAITPRDLALLIRDLVRDLMLDMKHEETDMLHPDLLRDDVVTIDQSDG